MAFVWEKIDSWFEEAEEIFKHAGELIHRFQLIGGPIQPYYSRPGA